MSRAMNPTTCSLPKSRFEEPYASFLVGDKDVANKPSRGVRVLSAVHGEAHEERCCDQRPDRQRDQDRATGSAWRELVETVDPMYSDDPAVPNLKYTFQQAR